MNEADSTNSEGRVKLVYLYIHKFRNIHKQGLRLTSDFNFETVAKDSHVSITISHNQNHIDDFFRLSNEPDESNPSGSEFEIDVTAIVGENGTGKSNILDLLGMVLSGTVVTEHCAIILKSGEELFTYTNFSSEHLTVQNLTNLEHVQMAMSSSDLSIEDHSNSGVRFVFNQNFRVIKYAHGLEHTMLDLRHSKRSQKENDKYRQSNLIDITTKALLNKDLTNYYARTIQHLDAYYYMEIYRQLFLINTYPNTINELHNIPREIYIHLSSDRTFSSIKNTDDLPGFESVDYFIENGGTNQESPSTNSHIKFKNQIQRSFIIALIEKYRKQLDLSKLNDLIIREGVEQILSSNFIPLLKEIQESFIHRSKPSTFEEDYNYIYRTVSFFKDVTPKVNATDSDVVDELELDLHDISRLFISESIFGVSRSTKAFSRVISFSWRRMSNGELARFSLFSRLATIADEVLHSDHLVLLIDEGDLNYHPEWQRKFLNDIIKFISELFPWKTVQFIFTSNTPFLVADLPKEKVVHLSQEVVSRDLPNGRKVTGTIMIVDKIDKPETFASNIHTLLSSNFYLSSFLGEFAKTKIEDVINELSAKGKNLPKERRGNIKKLIQQVGEKVIQERLKQIYETSTGERFATETENEAEIEALRKRIAEYDAMKKRLNEQRSDDDQD